MAIYELKTFSDIVTAVREELKIQSADSESIIRIKRNINTCYINDLCSKHWDWLRKSADITHNATSEGTCAVTVNSRTVTLSAALDDSRTGYKFSTNEKIYTILSHTGGSATVELEAEYVDETNATASYKIWSDAVVLPPDCNEVEGVYRDEKFVPIEMSGLHVFREKVLLGPKEESGPRYGCVAAQADPDQFTAVAGAPSVTHRSSSGLVKTLKFDADPSSYYPAGKRILVSGSTVKTYNGKFIVSSVDSTNFLVTYTGTNLLTQAETADSGITLKGENVEGQDERYTKLLIHPSLSDDYHTLHVDYFRYVKPLENDSDEPLMPITDRTVLLYGALRSSWVRERNEEVADRNERYYDRKLAEMCGKLDDSTDHVRLKVNKQYLALKRRRIRLPYDFKRIN